jgi:hypothetical protein
VSKRVRSGSKAGSKSKSATSILTAQSTLFHQPLLLEGEDAAAYDELLASISAAVNPVNIIDEIYIADMIILQWEILRYHRLKSKLIGALGLSYLKSFLIEEVDYDDELAEDVAELLVEGLPQDERDSAATLAQKYIDQDEQAVQRVKQILQGMGVDLDAVRASVPARLANEVLQGYLRREPGAVKTVRELFTQVGNDMDSFMASALVNNLDSVERIDRLITSAESRRDNALREIDRRRAALGEALRRTVQQIEDGQFKEIATTSDQGKNAA